MPRPPGARGRCGCSPGPSRSRTSPPSCLTARRCASAGAARCTRWWPPKVPSASKAPGGASKATLHATISASRIRRVCGSGSSAQGFIATRRSRTGSYTGCMRDMSRYFEFAVASNFSFLRGASHAEELMLQAAHIGLDGIGLCDRNSVAGVVRAHLIKREQKLALKYHPGARLVFADGTPDILAYPRDRAAWGRLCRLLTCGNLRAEKGDCILLLDDLLEHIDGLELIVMEASTRDVEAPPPEKWKSAPVSAGGKAKLRLVAGSKKPSLLAVLQNAAPGRVRLAGTMLHRGNDRARLARRAASARQANVPLIAVNDVLYHHPDRRELQDVITCIREHLTIDKAGRRLAVNAERFLKTPDEMARLFRAAPDRPEERRVGK